MEAITHQKYVEGFNVKGKYLLDFKYFQPRRFLAPDYSSQALRGTQSFWAARGRRWGCKHSTLGAGAPQPREVWASTCTN